MTIEFSPYTNKNSDKWEEIIKNLIKKHPVSTDELKKVILESWNSILKTSIPNYK